MRVLVVGAGAIGGYFGGRLLQAGRDVTFLVRPRRAQELADTGLIIKSPRGDISIRKPATILSQNIGHPFDLVLLSCKAYDLAGAIDSFAAAVGPETLVLPLLNGMRHLDMLDERFGRSHILGGQCVIAAPAFWSVLALTPASASISCRRCGRSGSSSRHWPASPASCARPSEISW